MTPAPTIPHGYRLVSGPHTAAEVEEGWTICADWTGEGLDNWQPRFGLYREADPGLWPESNDEVWLWGTVDGECSPLVLNDDPDCDIYRIEKVKR